MKVNNVVELKVVFPMSGAIANLEYYLCPDEPVEPAPLLSVESTPLTASLRGSPVERRMREPNPTRILSTGPCVVLNVDSVGPGQYASHQLQADYRVRINAYFRTSGYTSRGAARVFDSSDPDRLSNGDPDLGFPNTDCPGGGPGEGPGVGPDTPFSHCEPQRMVLIIQEEDKPSPDSNAQGGTLVFSFDEPISLSEVVLLDIHDDAMVKLRVREVARAVLHLVAVLLTTLYTIRIRL